jgi:hypothetical protein
MKKLSFIFLIFTCLCASGQVHIEWQKCLGGSDREEAYSVQQTMDLGYIVAGYTRSTDGDVWGNPADNSAGWLVRLAGNGDTLWTRCLDFSYKAYAAIQTSDIGYVVVGDGYKVIKLDSDGDTAWTKAFCKEYWSDKAYAVQQTSDEGYIVAGYVTSDLSGENPRYDDWYIVKLDADGDTLWTKFVEGSIFGEPYSIEQTIDGGYIVAGYKMINYDPAGETETNYDYYIVKLDTEGDTLWTRTFGGDNNDEAHSVQQTGDGGYIVAGFSDWVENPEYCIVKLSATGDIQWSRKLGGSEIDKAYAIQQTLDGGYIVAGNSYSDDGDVEGHIFQSDCWIVKLDDQGFIQQSDCIGGEGQDYATCIKQTSDGGYIISGYTDSDGGDVSGYHGGWEDWWVVKLSAISAVNQTPAQSISLYPNPATDVLFLEGIGYHEMDISLYAIDGRLIKQLHGTGIREIDINDLKEGAYLVRIITGEVILSQKIIKINR